MNEKFHNLIDIFKDVYGVTFYKYKNQTFGTAWLLLSISLLLHVIDEATHDFVSLYNSVVKEIRHQINLPIPTFTFINWIIGLAVLIATVLILTWYAYEGRRFMRIIAWPFSIIMLLNGLLHILGTFYFGYGVAGTYSAPLLVISSIWLLTILSRSTIPNQGTLSPDS